MAVRFTRAGQVSSRKVTPNGSCTTRRKQGSEKLGIRDFRDGAGTTTLRTMDAQATPAPVVATGYIPKNWSEEITVTQILVISLLPVVSLVLIYVLLRIVWKVPGSHGLPKYSQPSYGAIPSGESSLSHIDRPKSSLVEEGEVAGDYEESWLRTFDFVFLVGMKIYLAVLFILTYIYQPWLLTSSRFWLMQLPKLGVMMLVSLLGGIVCRFFCDVDEKGYIITNKSSKFKVNYTRKLQHFAAYMVPLVIKSEFSGPLALAWGDFFSMLGFLVLIKPIREHSKFFMLQFNSLDRPRTARTRSSGSSLATSRRACSFCSSSSGSLLIRERSRSSLCSSRALATVSQSRWALPGASTSTRRAAASRRTSTRAAGRAVRACSCRA
ncbi:hypothetical protein PINS_up010037 [Pythium insidiosum]|nr:hypothetical protein PINS_up010037 [Pythium insidiosum]